MKPSMTALIEHLESKEKAEINAIADWYAKARVELEAIAAELRTIKHPRQGNTCAPEIEVLEYSGAHGFPNQPYLKVYVPYHTAGFEVKVYCKPEAFSIQNSTISDVARVRLYVARAFMALF